MRLTPPSPPPGHIEADREPRAGAQSAARAWLMRHGEVSAEHAGTAYGSSDVPLSARGEEQTRALAGAFSAVAPRLVVASPLSRARELGAALAAATHAPLLLDERLAEIDRGAWQGLPLVRVEQLWRDAATRYWDDPMGWREHGGESEEQLVERTWSCFAERAAGGETLVLAAHYNVVRSIVAAALGLPPGRSHALRLDPGHALLLVDGPLGWALECSNVTAPVDPPAD